ncbi:MAG: VWA domain-containing protein [Cellvibrionaceae bacterium]
MRSRRRPFSTFNLSFLDIMSCGFGAVVLLFLIIKHQTDTQIKVVHQDLAAEVDLLSEQVNDGTENLVRLRNIYSDTSDELATAEGLARRIQEQLDETRVKMVSLQQEATPEEIKHLQEELKKLEQEKEALEDEVGRAGNNPREFLGEGDRQYLTGLRLGGKRNLILLDASASMLDDTIVNVIRRRNMSDSLKRNSPKWQRAVNTSQWLLSQLPPNSQFQVITFNKTASTLLQASNNQTQNESQEHSQSQWLTTENSEVMENTDDALESIVPQHGTSLYNAFQAVSRLSPQPDNIYLITDGLPTLESKPKSGTITGRERYRLFEQALKVSPKSIPINVILLPFEGDPLAASAFWQLAISTRGSFMAPAKDWP